MREMTIFFSKNTGNIQAAFEGVVSFEEAFYENYEDIKSFCIRVVSCFDIQLISNIHMYKIDLSSKQIVLKNQFLTNSNKLVF